MKRTTIIIPAEYYEAANAAARELDPEPNAGDSISIPLSPTGTEPATHFGASGLVSDEVFDSAMAIAASMPGSVVTEADFDTQTQSMNLQKVVTE